MTRINKKQTAQKSKSSLFILSIFFSLLISFSFLISQASLADAVTWTQGNATFVSNYYNISGSNIWLNDTANNITYINASYPQSIKINHVGFNNATPDSIWMLTNYNSSGVGYNNIFQFFSDTGGVYDELYLDGSGVQHYTPNWRTTRAGVGNVISSDHFAIYLTPTQFDNFYNGNKVVINGNEQTLLNFENASTGAVLTSLQSPASNYLQTTAQNFCLDNGSECFLGSGGNIFTNQITYLNSGAGAIPYIYNGNTVWSSGGIITQVNPFTGGASFLARDEGSVNRLDFYTYGGVAQIQSLSATDLELQANGSTNLKCSATTGFCDAQYGLTAPNICYSNGTGCNVTNTSYYLSSNPYSFYNSTTIPATNFTNVAFTNNTNNFTTGQVVTGNLSIANASNWATLAFNALGTNARPNILFNGSGIKSGIYDNGYGFNFKIDTTDAMTVSGDSGFIANAGLGTFKISDGTRYFTFRPDAINVAALRGSRYSGTSSEALRIYSYSLDEQPPSTNYSYVEFNATNNQQFVIQSKQKGSGNLTGLLLNFTGVNVSSSLNVTGNITGDGYYAGMWSSSLTGITGITLNQTLQAVNFSNYNNHNGFELVKNNTALELIDGNGAGMYQVNWHTEKDGTQNHVYYGYIFINEVQQNNTFDRAVGQVSNAMRMSGIGFIRINAYDNVTLRLADNSGTTTPAVYIKNVNLVRVGN